eukprot:3660853-Amphidinium_carterae.1
MAKTALFLASILCIRAAIPEASEPKRTKCNREDDGIEPDASVVVIARIGEDEARSAFAANGVVRT